MVEERKLSEVFTKKMLSSGTKRLLLTILVLSPIFLFFGLMYLYQLSFPDQKLPFVHFAGKDPRTEVIITWETDEKEESVVWYGIKKDKLANTTFDDDDEVLLHRVLLSNLSADTLYYYRVGKNIENPEFRSPIFSFTTAPNSTDKDFNFIIYSDSQQFYGIGWHNRICQAIAGHKDLSFVAEAGDLCQNWNYKPDWNQYFYEASQYMSDVPFVPNMGNHDGYYPEDDPNAELHHYERYFGATNTSADPHTFYYSFNWSNTQFVSAEISKTGDEDPNTARNKAHDRWLNKTLAKGQDKDFRILFFHRQMFSAEENNEVLIDRLVPIIEKYNVSLVMYGHHHHYERFLYNDVTYLCLGGGGGQQFGSNYFRETEYTKAFNMGPSFTKIDISSDQMKINTLSPENSIIDQCVLELDGSNAKLKE